MTLAVAILLINLSSVATWGSLSFQSASATSTAQDQGTTSQSAPAEDTKRSPPATAPAKPSATHSSTGKKPVHRKKPNPAGCDPAASGASPSTTSSTKPAATSGSTAQAATPPPTNCPPPKIIVSHGGTTEPSIQLAGGPGGNDESQKRDAAAQMLGTTETNLKKLTGQSLSESQQESVAQIRQFMEQSKSALASGDAERARTLAWKAQVLSEDLVKPQK